MRIVLAYPIDDLGQPDEEVDVDRPRGRQLIRDGLARLAPGDNAPADLRAARAATAPTEADRPANPTVAEVRAFAADEGITVAEAKRRLRDARSSTAGEAGTDTKEGGTDGR
jgi:hypothetical protein